MALYLRLLGHRILAQRYRTRSGEIDLIARRGRTLVFVEVKLRATQNSAIDPVTARSEERIVRTGEVFLSRHPGYVRRDFALRYDIAVVIGPSRGWRAGVGRIELRRDVFRGW